MSKENIVLFIDAVNTDPALNLRVAEAERSVEAWCVIAKDAGFPFTAREFESAVEDAMGRKLSTANAVQEWLDEGSRVGAELPDEALRAVAGGLLSQPAFRVNTLTFSSKATGIG